MIKHIIAGISLILAIAAWIYMAQLDKEVNKFDRIAQLIKSTQMEDKKLTVKNTQYTNIQTQPIQTQKNDNKNSEAQKKLEALKKKAGNIALFKVSPLYKKKCSSCHGVMGEGIIGPKLMGLSKKTILEALHDFKSGKRKNYVMYGLLGNMDEKQLESLSEEISTFEQKYQQASSK